jgi:acetyl esterase/lipase
MKKAKSILLIIVLAILASCQKQLSSENNSVAAVDYPNVSYGADPQQTMDIHLPADRSTATTKVMVMIHGGAWTTGDKNELTPFVDSFKRRLPDYAIFNINYRLSAAPANIFPTQENDVKAAIDFIVGKSAQYGISDKYAFIGASAGGILLYCRGIKMYPL